MNTTVPNIPCHSAPLISAGLAFASMIARQQKRLCLALLTLGVTLAVTDRAAAQEDGKVYIIRNKSTEKVLTPDRDGGLLIQEPEPVKPKKAQYRQWKLLKEGEFFKIVNVGSGKMLMSPSKETGAQIVLEGADGKGARLWSFTARGAKHFTIESRRGGLFMDVANNDASNGNPVIQYSLNDRGASRANQLWELIPVP